MRERVAARIGGKQSVAAARIDQLRSFDLMRANRRDEAIELIDSAIEKVVQIEGPDSTLAASMRISAAYALTPTTHAKRAQEYFDLAMRTLEDKGPRRRAWASYEKARFAATRHWSYHQITAKEALSIITRTRAELTDTNEVIPEDMVAQIDLDESVVLLHWGNVRDALTVAERGIERLRKSGPREAVLKRFAGWYGVILMNAGRHEEADQWLRERLKQAIEAGAGSHPYNAGAYQYVAQNLIMARRFDEAAAVLDSAPKFPRIVGEGPVNTNRYNLMIQLARSVVLGQRGQYEQAMAIFPNELIEEPGPTESSDSIEARAHLGELLCLSGRRKAGLAEMEAALSQALVRSGSLFEHNPTFAYMRAATGLCALRSGKRARAMEFAAAARAAFDAQPQVSPYFKEPLQMLERELRIIRR
jgi:tetratricopeptide (TPR) repeat protein